MKNDTRQLLRDLKTATLLGNPAAVNLALNGLVSELPEDEQKFLAPQNIMSILLVPIMIQERFWGVLGFDDCHSNRRWRDEEELVLFAKSQQVTFQRYEFPETSSVEYTSS